MTYWLAFDAGATRTTAGLYAPDGALVREAVGKPCNPVAYGMSASLASLFELAQRLTPPQGEKLAAAAGISGAASPALQQELGERLCEALRLERALVTTDLSPLLYANAPGHAAILALAGTGAAVLAQNPEGRMRRFGGRGSLFGDEGSAYAIAVAAMRAAAHAVDGLAPPTRLTVMLPQAAKLKAFEDLVGWSAAAPKNAIAQLARAVTNAALEGDAVARACIREQAFHLAAHVRAAAAWLQLPAVTPLVFMHGGVFRHCALYHDFFNDTLFQEDRLMAVPAPINGHHAVFMLSKILDIPEWLCQAKPGSKQTVIDIAPTERHASSPVPLDKMTPIDIVRAMNLEDTGVADAVARQANAIAVLIDMAAEALKAGGRILYAGAGTSGRLGVLDASECPPTFGVAPERVCALIAGGDTALRNSGEGVEDDTASAHADIDSLNTGPKDVVIGIAASGNTPYTRALLERATEKGAQSALICCNPYCNPFAGLLIALDTGPEILPGSTRLKAGTATKMVLNIISTGAMARAGFIYDGLMVGMRPANAKLRQRATRIVACLTSLDEEKAAALLREAGDDIRTAVFMARRNSTRQTAVNALHSAQGILRAALEENA